MARLPSVECSLEIATDPASPGSDPAWRVLRAEVSQRLDHPWLAQVTLVTDVVDTRVEALLGRPATLAWERPGSEIGPHQAHGVVTRAEYVGTFDRQLHARLRVEPALALLRHGRRRRIFEDMTVPAIVRAVLDPLLAEHGAELQTDALAAPHPERDYCVQYDETDLDFVRRILAEEGITMVFDPAAELDHLRLVDTNDGFLGVAHDRLSTGPQGLPEIPVIPLRPEQAEEESVQSLASCRAITTARFTASAWDFKHQPPSRLQASAETSGEADTGEHIEHATMRMVELERGDGPTDDATPLLAQHAAERASVEAVELRGGSLVTAFAPGATFELYAHPSDGLNDRGYLLTRVQHRIEIPSAALGGDGRSSTYLNELSCVPLDQPYRPSRLAPPRAVGPETALVVGPQPEEVHTDPHGRVRVRMHWDERDELPSVCWLRVGQTWAGPGFGTLFLPRVGMEVIVSFLGGNPERPIVTGCVYNALNVPPVALPEHRTRSTIRTSSSPGGRGHNELRFEDGAGQEEVYLRAQRNLRERVGVDHATTVGRDQTLHVGRNRTTTIDGDDNIEVVGYRELRLGGSHLVFTQESFIVDAKAPSIPGGKAIEINTPHQAVIHAHEALDLTCHSGPASSIELRPDRITVKRQEELLELTAGGIRLEAPESITLTVGGTSLELTASGLHVLSSAIRLVAKDSDEPGSDSTQLVLAGNAGTLHSSTRASVTGGSADITLHDDVEVNGQNVKINGVDSTELGGTTINIDADVSLKLAGKALEWVGDLVGIN